MNNYKIYKTLEDNWPNLIRYLKKLDSSIKHIDDVDLGYFIGHPNYVLVNLSDDGEMSLTGYNTEDIAKNAVIESNGYPWRVDSVWCNDKKINFTVTVHFNP